MRFEAIVAKVNTKPAKEGKRITEVVLTTDTRKSLVGSLSLLVDEAVTIELNPQQYDFSLDTDENGEPRLDPTVNEEDWICSVCGHAQAHHNGDNGCCLGDEGMCTCTGFVPTEIPAVPTNEETEELIAMALQEICDTCGHERGQHVGPEGACIGEGDDGETPCSCQMFVRREVDAETIEALTDAFMEIEPGTPAADRPDAQALAEGIVGNTMAQAAAQGAAEILEKVASMPIDGRVDGVEVMFDLGTGALRPLTEEAITRLRPVGGRRARG